MAAWACDVESADHGNITPATSNHPGGCNVAMADGHVQFIKSSISMNTWWQLGTRANGEVISSDNWRCAIWFGRPRGSLPQPQGGDKIAPR